MGFYKLLDKICFWWVRRRAVQFIPNDTNVEYGGLRAYYRGQRDAINCVRSWSVGKFAIKAKDLDGFLSDLKRVAESRIV